MISMLAAMPFFSRVLLASASLLAAGCSHANDAQPASEPPPAIPGISEPDAATAAGPTSDAESAPPPVHHPSVGVIDIGGLDTAAPAQMNDTFETAVLIEPGIGAHQDVVRFQQSNYFFFDATEAGFFELWTMDREFTPDVVISVYDSERRLIAENDDGSLWPNDSLDARLVMRASRPGRYYAKVSDLKTSADLFRDGASLLYYHLDIRPVTSTTAGFGYAAATGEASVQFALDDATGYSFVTLVGSLESNLTRSFAFEGLSARALIGHLLPAGVPGNGSSASTGRVRVLDMGQRVLAQLDGQLAETKIYPPISTGRTLVTVEAPENVGDNGFFALDLVMLPENPAEQNETANGQPTGAESIVLKGAPTQRGLLLSDVAPGDVDYYSFNASEGSHVAVSCEGQSAGSGVRALRAEVRDAKDQSLTVFTESPEHELQLQAWQVPSAGMYFLRFASDAPAAAEAVRPWVRCVVFVR